MSGRPLADKLPSVISHLFVDSKRPQHILTLFLCASQDAKQELMQLKLVPSAARESTLTQLQEKGKEGFEGLQARLAELKESVVKVTTDAVKKATKLVKSK